MARRSLETTLLSYRVHLPSRRRDANIQRGRELIVEIGHALKNDFPPVLAQSDLSAREKVRRAATADIGLEAVRALRPALPAELSCLTRANFY